ncbi:MAG: caspase family protein [Rhodospirillales bacterium]|nr:caspase family protein [Rhodospirillales bacterium]
MGKLETAKSGGPDGRHPVWDRILPLLFLMIFLAAPMGAWAANLHAILVIDSDDKSIGRMVDLDRTLIEKELSQIAKMTGLNVRKTVLRGNKFKLDKVGAAINSLKVGADDVILFYYSGHGFRTKQKTYKWPFFYFHSNTPLDYAWVIQTLKAKGARLTIALTDACNNVANITVSQADQYRAKSLPNPDAYKTLFLKSVGFVVATSSIPGETSTATSKGSLFTLSFLKALHDEAAKSKPSWRRLMKNGAGQKLYLNNKYRHTPFYEMNVSMVSPGASTTTTTQPPPTTPGGQPTAVNPGVPQPTVYFPTAQPSDQPPSPPAQPAQQGPSMACAKPSNAGPVAGKYNGLPYWRGMFVGLNYIGHSAASPEECHNICAKDENCVSWTWRPQRNNCLLKHYCPKLNYTEIVRHFSGYSGRPSVCGEMRPGCGAEQAAARPAPPPAPVDPLSGGGGWGQPAAPLQPQAPAQPPAQGGWGAIN